ncbi:oligosaccharide flippase family protein [Hungatella sp.]|uniref:lipopolysaccharide biosynthesis protein n=1 Tax=Hungatella sp. TaxID=2613924 RepID=UPI002A7FE015|nr:oligosaccharide flippase family protein [Hungatella sp.]
MTGSRSKNVSLNTIFALSCQAFNLLINFITRTVFIKVLGTEYLGVNGLFTNVLTILSFAELGIGNAIVFNLYKPLAVGDKLKIGSLMALYKKAYTMIGLFVAITGLGLTPLLGVIIKKAPDIPENISVLYNLFLANTVVSYFFAYKKNIIIAEQKNYIVLIVTQVVNVAKIIFQIIFLFVTHQYIIYLIIQIICTITENIICYIVADKLYPYLKDPVVPLNKEETSEIIKDVKALALYKFGSVILNGTDNILISSMIGVREVGLVSNYVLLTTSCSSILNKVTEAFTSSVGNLNATSDPGKQYEVFKKLLFITVWIYGFASVGLILVSQSFITTWLGRDYLLEMPVLIAIVAEFYVKGVHSVAYTYRSTLGFFVEGRWSALAAAVINLVLSIILCQRIGLAGIFIATPIARMLSIGIVDPVLIFRKGFKKNVAEYYVTYFGYFILFVAIVFGCKMILDWINISGWIGVIINAITVTVVFNSIVISIFGRTKMFKELQQTFLKIITK